MERQEVKSLDEKLARIHADPHGAKDFLLADAKDADMAFGIAAPGRNVGANRLRSLQEFRDIIEEIVAQGLVDIMLMSAHTSDLLTIRKRIFDGSAVTPAARVNDTTDIHIVRGSCYSGDPVLPFRTATLDHIQCGHVDCRPEERRLGADLGLYSVTFNNDTALDRWTRLDAATRNFRYRGPNASAFGISSRSSIRTGRAPSIRPSFPISSTTRSSARWPASPRRAGRSFSRWSIMARRRWRSLSDTIRI